jgi:hypothetical protein
MVEEFPSLEELGNSITENTTFPSSLDNVTGFPPESPGQGYMSEEGESQDQADVMGRSMVNGNHGLYRE